MAKSSVSALEEYCAQRKIQQPKYTFITCEDGGFMCKVEILDMESFGNGRSKRDAKHLSALNIIKKIRSECDNTNSQENNAFSGVESLGDRDSTITNINQDMLKELRDYCVQHEMPLPTIEIVQQSGPPNAPQFVAECKVASIKRFGKSDKKKDARQKAAIEMFKVICIDNDYRDINKQVASVTSTCDTLLELENERRLKFKTYRDLTEAGNQEFFGVKLCDRHNYFKNYYPHLKEAAFKVIDSTEYNSDKDQAMDIIKALHLEAKTTQMDSTTIEPLLFIELNSELDCVFLGMETTIYAEIISYFKSMLT